VVGLRRVPSLHLLPVPPSGPPDGHIILSRKDHRQSVELVPEELVVVLVVVTLVPNPDPDGLDGVCLPDHGLEVPPVVAVVVLTTVIAPYASYASGGFSRGSQQSVASSTTTTSASPPGAPRVGWRMGRRRKPRGGGRVPRPTHAIPRRLPGSGRPKRKPAESGSTIGRPRPGLEALTKTRRPARKSHSGINRRGSDVWLNAPSIQSDAINRIAEEALHPATAILRSTFR
jgi:hypothetical protein